MRRLFHLLLLFLLPAVCAAEGASALGRLFHTPAERAALDQLRQGGMAGKAEATAEQITVDGVVRRSNGKSTTWINGMPQRDNEHAQGVLVLGQPGYGSAALQLPSGKSVNLKAGQIYDMASGQVQDGYGIPSSQAASTRSPAAKSRASKPGLAPSTAAPKP